MKFLDKLRSLFRKGKLEADMAEEMRYHVEMQTERNVAAGMAPDEARYAALRQFGNVGVIQEQAREVRGWVWLDQLGQDVRYSLRSLRKNPGFTSVVVLTLALGLGVNMAVFTWFNAVAYRPLPVLSPEQLYTLKRLDEKGRETKSMSYTDFVTYRDQQTMFSGLTASAVGVEGYLNATDDILPAGALPVELRLELVSTNYFSVFGVPITLGRPLVPADENSSRALPVVVLSYRSWQNYFGGDPGIIGRKLTVRGLAETTLTVVGVAGEGFYGTKPGRVAGWVPMMLRPGDAWRTGLKATDYALTGRLRPGLAPEQAAEELRRIANELLARQPGVSTKSETVVLTKASTYLTFTKKDWLILLPMVCLFGSVFLVSCANASNLILARTVTRQFEFAVRSALGASRRRLFTQLMTENLVLGVLGGLVGWGVAAGLLQFTWPWLLEMIPGAREEMAGLYLHADHRVFAFTLVGSIGAGVAGGFFPALQMTRRNVDSALKKDGSVFGQKLRLSRVRNFLAVAQLALSSALVFTAGMLAHRVLQNQFQDAGFDRSRLLILDVLAPPAQRDAARTQMLARLRALPEVAAVSEMPGFPFATSQTNISVPAATGPDTRMIGAEYLSVPDNYFTTLPLPLIRGRVFTVDEIESDQIAVISETAARELWPDSDALGKTFEAPATLLSGRARSAADATPDAPVPRMTFTVIGVVRDVQIYDTWSGKRPVIFLPFAPTAKAAGGLLIRTHNAAEFSVVTLQQLGREVTSVAARVHTADEVWAHGFIVYRVTAWVAGILAGISLIVAVIGLYGVMSFTVNQRVKEIGIRLALGATPRRVVTGIILESLRLVGMGTLVGYGLSVVIMLSARALLFNVDGSDPLASMTIALLLGILGIFACWLPARRAAKVDAMVALRAE